MNRQIISVFLAFVLGVVLTLSFKSCSKNVAVDNTEFLKKYEDSILKSKNEIAKLELLLENNKERQVQIKEKYVYIKRNFRETAAKKKDSSEYKMLSYIAENLNERYNYTFEDGASVSTDIKKINISENLSKQIVENLIEADECYEIMTEKENYINIQDSVIEKKDNIIFNLEVKDSIYNINMNDLEKTLQKEKRRNKIFNNVSLSVGITGLLFGILK